MFSVICLSPNPGHCSPCLGHLLATVPAGLTLLACSMRPPLFPQELVRLLQQTVRSSQYDRYFSGSRPTEGIPKGLLALLHQKDGQILGLTGQLERCGLERESLQLEVRTLKGKVGELNEQLGMLMETIQAKDEVIVKLSECEGSGSPLPAGPISPPTTPTGRDQLEVDRLKVRARRRHESHFTLPFTPTALDVPLQALTLALM